MQLVSGLLRVAVAMVCTHVHIDPSMPSQCIEGLGDLRDGQTGLFQHLSPEMLMQVLHYLGFGERLKLATLVCKSFRCLLAEPSLWTSIGISDVGTCASLDSFIRTVYQLYARDCVVLAIST